MTALPLPPSGSVSHSESGIAGPLAECVAECVCARAVSARTAGAGAGAVVEEEEEEEELKEGPLAAGASCCNNCCCRDRFVDDSDSCADVAAAEAVPRGLLTVAATADVERAGRTTPDDVTVEGERAISSRSWATEATSRCSVATCREVDACGEGKERQTKRTHA